MIRLVLLWPDIPIGEMANWVWGLDIWDGKGYEPLANHVEIRARVRMHMFDRPTN